MTLQTKFLLMISLLALAIAGSGLGAFWAFWFLHQELRTPFKSSTSVLDSLRDIKRLVESQANVLAGSEDEPPANLNTLGQERDDVDAAWADQPTESHTEWTSSDPRLAKPPLPDEDFVPGFRSLLERSGGGLPPLAGDAADRIASLTKETERVISLLEGDDWYRKQIGTTWRNIKQRVQLMHARSAVFVTPLAGVPSVADADRSRRLAVRECYEIHELIERTEERILRNADIALSHGDLVQSRLAWWLVWVVLFGGLLSVLSVILLRRWVQRPVAALRDAASHIARGDLTYRVPVAGRDELALLSGEVNHMAQMVHVMQEERIERERLAAIGGMVRRLVHNVRNPLAGIRGLAEVTRLDFAKGTEHRDNLDLIVSTADTFERWLNELLSVTNPATINPRETNVKEWLRGVVEVHRPMAQSKGVELRTDADSAPIAACFDPSHLDHALAALVSNAIEASASNTVVTVSCRQTSESDWEVSVADQGPGVSKELAAKIFEPHFTTKRHGTGMGLAMAQQVARAHSGRIRVETASIDGKSPLGALFRLSLPLQATSNSRS